MKLFLAGERLRLRILLLSGELLRLTLSCMEVLLWFIAGVIILLCFCPQRSSNDGC